MPTSALNIESTHFIPLQQAIDMTSLYRQQQESILIPEMRNQQVLPTCETFNRAAFDFLLAEPGCVGLRFYLGMDASSKIKLIAVGVNAANEDMLPGTGAVAKAITVTDVNDDNRIVEDGQRCPDDCPPPSPLNS